MKAVHNKAVKKYLSLAEWLVEAKQLESEDEQAAIKEYKQIALAYPTSEYAFNRLMILFRKLNQTKDELYWIEKAIDNFHKHFHKPAVKSNPTISKLSKSISRSMGLSDKKGKPVFQSAPVARWEKRKLLLKKRVVN